MEKVKNKNILHLDNYRNQFNYWLNKKEALSLKERTPKEEEQYQATLSQIKYYNDHIKDMSKIGISFDNLSTLMEFLNNKEFLIKMFKTKRETNMALSHGVELIDVENLKSTNNANSQTLFLKYMVHLKTQLAYAVTDEDHKEAKRLIGWFTRFENLLKIIFETEDIKLIYDRKKYNFILEENNKKFDFHTLSDGFSAVLEILTGIMMGMEKDEESLHNYDMNGIVLIDELDTHLHISLQKKIFKVLTEFFPNVQFIITTHSPFILNSVENAFIYDLEEKVLIENMSFYPYDTISEIHFGASSYSEILLEKVQIFQELAFKAKKTKEEEIKLNSLRDDFKNLDPNLSKKLAMKIWDLEEELN